MPSAALHEVHADAEGQVRAATAARTARWSWWTSARRPSAKAADIFLQVRPGKDFEVITTLRALVKGQPVDRERVAETGLTVEQLQDLVDRMKRARFGVLFFGMGLSMTRGKHMNSAAVLTLAAEMNAFTKFVAMPMRGHGNVTGADVVMRWTTGYPFGVNLSPRLSALQPGRVLDGRPAGPRRQRRRAGPGRRPRRDDAAAGDRPPGAHPDDRARPEGDAHQPAGARAHHDGGDGHQRAGHGLPHGRDPAAAAAGAEVAVPDRRGGGSPHPPGRGRQAAAGRRPSNGTPLVGVDDSMLRITGGKVYDPANGVDGEVQDVCIADGRIVADVEGGRTIDATGMVVFPGGVDVHTHVAGAALNFARGHDPREPARSARRSSTRPSAATGHRRADADHLRHRLPLRRHGLHHGQRGRRAGPVAPSTRTRSCATRRSSTRPAAC